MSALRTWRVRSIPALARGHGVSRAATTAVADLMPDHNAIVQEDTPILELPVTLDMPGKVAGFLRTADLKPAERVTLDQRVPVRRGQRYSLRIMAVAPWPPPATRPLPAPRQHPGPVHADGLSRAATRSRACPRGWGASPGASGSRSSSLASTISSTCSR
ncbi:hypothetical protein [Streptomyces rimosus]|uniref:hypothetical protein n=1 Tax=Streptomyces rimosus TaxID=1927 RepID=UPI0037AF1B4E